MQRPGRLGDFQHLFADTIRVSVVLPRWPHPGGGNVLHRGIRPGKPVGRLDRMRQRKPPVPQLRAVLRVRVVQPDHRREWVRIHCVLRQQLGKLPTFLQQDFR